MLIWRIYLYLMNHCLNKNLYGKWKTFYFWTHICFVLFLRENLLHIYTRYVYIKTFKFMIFFLFYKLSNWFLLVVRWFKICHIFWWHCEPMVDIMYESKIILNTCFSLIALEFFLFLPVFAFCKNWGQIWLVFYWK